MSSSNRGYMVTEARKALAHLNAEFQGRGLAPQEFYAQLQKNNCDPEHSVMVEFIPDGAQSVFGRIIAPDGRIFAFDIAFGAEECSTWQDVTEEFHKEVRTLRQHKPWSAAIVALELFEAGGGFASKD
jgi:hypothetical protein